MEKFKQMMMDKMKDKKSGMGDTEKEAKMSVLEHVRGMAQDMMKDRLNGGMKKVEVASDSKDGLKEGLDKAKALMEGSKEEEDSETPEQEASEEGSEDETADHGDPSPEASEDEDSGDMDHMSEEELDAKLAELMAMKKSMASRKI